MTPSDLRAWREGRGLSRRDAADLLGLDPRTLEALEQGRTSGNTLMPVLERLTYWIDRAEGRMAG